MRIAMAMALMTAAAQASTGPEADKASGWNCATLETRRVFAADQQDDALVREIATLLDPVARGNGGGDHHLVVSGALPERVERFVIEAERKGCRDGSNVPVIADLELQTVRITACASIAGEHPVPVRHVRRWTHDATLGWRLVERREAIDPDCRID